MIEGVDDASEFSATRLALSTIGISDEDQHDMWRVLAAILHLGNVTCVQCLNAIWMPSHHECDCKGTLAYSPALSPPPFLYTQLSPRQHEPRCRCDS